MVDSLERPPVVVASKKDVAPGALPVRQSRDTAPTRATRSSNTNEESKQEEELPNFTRAYTGLQDDSSRIGGGSGLYFVEAQRVPQGNDEETIMVAEAHYIKTKWYQHSVYL